MGPDFSVTLGPSSVDRLMLDDAFTLTHITGYVQPKAEWLAEIRAGRFTYHAIRQHDLTVAPTGDTVRLVGGIITDATVYGHRADWRLTLSRDYRRNGDSWLALRAIATTW